MSDLFYTGLGRKVHKTGNLSRPPSKPTFLSDGKINYHHYTEKEIISGYCSDLMNLLEEEDLKSMVSGIFQVQAQLSNLQEDQNIKTLPVLDEFFRQLSPLLLQVVWENLDENSDFQNLLKKWKEAVRISLEEELYNWQESF